MKAKNLAKIYNLFIYNILKFILIIMFIYKDPFKEIIRNNYIVFILLGVCNWSYLNYYLDEFLTKKIVSIKNNDFKKIYRFNILVKYALILFLILYIKFSFGKALILLIFLILLLFVGQIFYLNIVLWVYRCVNNYKYTKIIINFIMLVLYIINGFCFDVRILPLMLQKVFLLIPVTRLNLYLLEVIKNEKIVFDYLFIYNLIFIFLGILILQVKINGENRYLGGA